MNEEIRVQAINIDDVSDIGQTLPDGKYVARLSAVNPKDGKDNAAGTVEAVYDVLQGDHKDMEIRIWYGLKITRSSKNGKIYAPGISEMKQTFAAIGTPLPNGFHFPTDPINASKVYATIMHPTKVPSVDIALFQDQYTDSEGNLKKVQRKKILGRSGAAGNGVTATLAQQPPPTLIGASPAPAAPAAPAPSSDPQLTQVVQPVAQAPTLASLFPNAAPQPAAAPAPAAAAPQPAASGNILDSLRLT